MSVFQKNIFLLFSFLLFSFVSEAQLTAIGFDKQGSTDFGDTYYMYCSPAPGSSLGVLTATSNLGASTFAWEKYDSNSNAFILADSKYTISEDTITSTISHLDDGCYKVTMTDSLGNSIEKQAWIVHNWIEVTRTEIPDSSSNCVEFKIWADYDYAPLIVYNTKTGAEISLRTSDKFTFLWKQDQNIVSNELNPFVYELIASESPVKYDLAITDEFKCTGIGSVDYDSKVTKADFDYDPSDGEAVLEVTFTNNSINYDSTLWFFYKDNFKYSLEVAAADGAPVDSIDFVLLDNAPVYKYEYTGEYRVKLVTVKINETTGNCRDTFYMDPGAFINVKEHLVDVPNVFTPNGDRKNDVWVVRTQSLKSMNVKVYNRWGGLVHSWKYSNITSNDYTYEHSVWDGRIGNRMAAPGVYYYVITYEGRDVYTDNPTKEEKKIQVTDRIGKPVKETVTGFVHLFRSKN